MIISANSHSPSFSRLIYSGKNRETKKDQALDWHLTQNTHFWDLKDSGSMKGIGWGNITAGRCPMSQEIKAPYNLIIVVTVVITIKLPWVLDSWHCQHMNSSPSTQIGSWGKWGQKMPQVESTVGCQRLHLMDSPGNLQWSWWLQCDHSSVQTLAGFVIALSQVLVIMAPGPLGHWLLDRLNMGDHWELFRFTWTWDSGSLEH